MFGILCRIHLKEQEQETDKESRQHSTSKILHKEAIAGNPLHTVEREIDILETCMILKEAAVYALRVTKRSGLTILHVSRLFSHRRNVCSDLISPCKCKGSSLLIHKHCLERWQEISYQNHAPLKALFCQICHSKYRHPSTLNVIYSLTMYVLSIYLALLFKYMTRMFYTFAIKPLKLFVHAFLVVITIPWGQFSLGSMMLTWIGNEFPPRLALACSSEPYPGMTEGLILVASPRIPSSSIFHRAIVILLEYSVENGARGVILNRSADFDTSEFGPGNDQNVGYGGPLDKYNVTVIHDYRDLYNESDFTCLAEGIFITEYNSSNHALSRLSSKAKALIKLSKVAAMKAKMKFQAARSAATAYAARAKNSIALSLKSAFSSTRRVVSRVSRRLGARIPQMPTPAPETDSGLSLTAIDEKEPSLKCESCGGLINTHESPTRIPFRQPRLPNESDNLCPSCNQNVKVHYSHPAIASITTSFAGHSGTDSDDNMYEDDDNAPIKTNMRMVKGCAKWGECQLDGEIRRKLWYILPLKHEYVFPDKRESSWWEELITKAKNAIKDDNFTPEVEERENIEVDNFFSEYTLSFNDIIDAISG